MSSSSKKVPVNIRIAEIYFSTDISAQPDVLPFSNADELRERQLISEFDPNHDPDGFMKAVRLAVSSLVDV